jgi:ABC-2 type transport system ATP-binding protein
LRYNRGMQELIIRAKDVSKVYGSKKKASKKSVIGGDRKEALKNFELEVNKGEIIGLVGPNGAGKTTLLKILSGVLSTTEGEVEVLGYNPLKREREFLKQIAFMTGIKSQLWWDLPALDSYNLKQKVYELPQDIYEADLKRLIELVEIEDIMEKPIRNMSLGQRMRCELVYAFLHRPKVIFLDEPTLGLDSSSQIAVRMLIAKLSHELDVTVILTSHYMDDIEALADRVVVIDEGMKLFDDSLDVLKGNYSEYKNVLLTLSEDFSSDGSLLELGFTFDDVIGVKHAFVAIERNDLLELLQKVVGLKGVLDVDVKDESIALLIEKLRADSAE